MQLPPSEQPQTAPPPLISVILPTYNGARHLRDSIRSCLEQSHKNLELICVDDGSPDPLTREILGQVSDPRLRVLTLEKNGGLPRALNAGFREARGDLLTWTSDDNLFRPEALATMAQRLADLKADFVYARATCIDEEGEVVGSTQPRPPEDLVLSNCVGACFLYSRRVMEAIGEFDPEMTLTEDYDYWVRVSKRFRMVPIEDDLYLYRFHETALTSVHGSSRINEMVDHTRRRHFTRGRILAAEGTRAYERRDYGAARGLLLGALLRRPLATALYRPLAVSCLPDCVTQSIIRAKKLF
jgi:glycosyltransferase involved in cell wall biosynthesis